MANDALVGDVSDELLWDPKVDSVAIAVSAHDGVVTLRGTVGSLRQKREAKRAAKRVFGVRTVINDVQVRLLDSVARVDADLRGDVLRALVLDSLVPSTIDATVFDGVVTLSGRATCPFERDEAESVAASVPGVIEVLNEVDLDRDEHDASSIEESIRKALVRNAKLDDDALEVDALGGKVRIEGTVSSWSEHDDTVAVAWAAPGVVAVDDQIVVAYSQPGPHKETT